MLPREVIAHDEAELSPKPGQEAPSVKIALADIFPDGVVTGLDMQNGYVPLVLYAMKT